MKKNYRLYISIVGLMVLMSGYEFADQTKKTNSPRDAKINWVTIEEVQELGKENPKKIFVDVYTDWCGWCKVMDKNTFTNDEVIDFVNQNYYAVKLNAEGKEKIKFNGQEVEEWEFARALKVSSFPTIVLINEDFTSVSPVPGYRKPKEFLKMLQKFFET